MFVCSLLHKPQLSVVEASKNVGQLKKNTSLWSRPHFSAARPVSWIHPHIWVSFCDSWWFVFLRRSICSLRHLRHYAGSWNFIHVCMYASAAYTQHYTLIAPVHEPGPRKQRHERRSGGVRLKPGVEFVWKHVVSFNNMPRKKPFSNKQKKKQLQVKRERKRGEWQYTRWRASVSR